MCRCIKDRVAGLRSAALLYRVLRAPGTSSSQTRRSEVLVQRRIDCLRRKRVINVGDILAPYVYTCIQERGGWRANVTARPFCITKIARVLDISAAVSVRLIHLTSILYTHLILTHVIHLNGTTNFCHLSTRQIDKSTPTGTRPFS